MNLKILERYSLFLLLSSETSPERKSSKLHSQISDFYFPCSIWFNKLAPNMSTLYIVMWFTSHSLWFIFTKKSRSVLNEVLLCFYVCFFFSLSGITFSCFYMYLGFFFFHFILDILHKRTVETRVDIICPENHELFSEELMGRRAESIKSIVKLVLGFVAALIASIFPLTLNISIIYT